VDGLGSGTFFPPKIQIVKIQITSQNLRPENLENFKNFTESEPNFPVVSGRGLGPGAKVRGR
jgi:hypothetical protein